MKKVCKTCDRSLTLWRGFYKHPSYADGYMTVCKRCHIAYVAANRELKFEQYRKTKRVWSSRPENVEKRRLYRRSERGREVHRAARIRYRRFMKVLQGAGANG